MVACRIRNKIANRDVVKDFMAMFGCVQIKVNHLKLAFHRLIVAYKEWLVQFFFFLTGKIVGER